MGESTLHILLVEDESDHVELIRRAFETSEMDVDLAVAQTLSDAKARLAESEPDLLIADLLLPDGQGMDLLSTEPPVPFPAIIMTSFGNEVAAVNAMKAGAMDYVVKSAGSLSDMPHTVERLLNHRRMQQQIEEHKRNEEVAAKERQILRQLLESQDRQRQLISYEIHDGLTQQLAAAILSLQAYEEIDDKNSDGAAEAIKTVGNLLSQGLGESRRLISGLRPPTLDELGIVPAIQELVGEYNEQSPPSIEFLQTADVDGLSPLLENSIFRIIQEALTNAHQHSKSDRVLVELTEDGDNLCISIRDWGVGFDPELIATDRFGLKGIRERARLFGGHAVIETTPGEGTSILVTLPESAMN